MRTLRVLTHAVLFLLLLASSGFAATPSAGNSYRTDWPATSYAIEDSYSSSAGGIDSVLTNPAGIARSSTFEVSLGYSGALTERPRLTFTVSDEDMGNLGGEGHDYMKGGLYFTDDPTEISSTEFRSRDVRVGVDYEHGGGVTEFGFACNFGDVLSFGISRKRPASFAIGLDTYAPTIFGNTVDMRNSTIETSGTSFYVDDNSYAYFDDGVNPTVSTEGTLYGKFTRNSSFAAVSTSIDLSDQVMDSREMVITVGGRYGSLLWGLNAIPISSTISLVNNAVTRTTSSSADLVYYVPNFDPENPTSIADWFNETDKLYTREAGYNTYTIVLSPESNVYRAFANGNYSASTVQVDLGFIWEMTNDISMSLAYENIGGASLIYRGTGVTYTVESYVDEAGPPDFQLGSTEVWVPLKGEPSPVEDSGEFSLPEDFTVNIPRKGRIGISTMKPFFLAVDYERYFTDVLYADMTVTDLGFLKVGGETSLFGLPLILRADTTWLLRPTILGVKDPKQAEDINKFLDQFPAIPTRTTFGLGLDAFGYKIGTDFSENHASLLSVYEGNLLDFLKTISYDIYLRSDNWDVTYTAVAEPFYLFAQNADLIPTDGSEAEIRAEDVKTNWVYSLKFGYRF